MTQWYGWSYFPQKTAGIEEPWFHGSSTMEPFEKFDPDVREREGTGDPKHWNCHLGSHFSSEHDTAAQIAFGHSGAVYHVGLAAKNPKHYYSEKDLDRAARNWAKDRDYSLGQDSDPANSLRYSTQVKEIAHGFREDLKSKGHDGITYGNEYEGSHLHECAIAFHPEDITIHSVHHASEPCEEGTVCQECLYPRTDRDWGDCPHCGHDLDEPGQYSEQLSHHSSLLQHFAFWGETDWAEHHDKIGDEVHRGLFAPQSHQAFGAPASDEDIAHMLIHAHQEEQFPYNRDQDSLFGTHFTSDEETARGFARMHEEEHHSDDLDGECDHDEHHEATPVVFHARKPDIHHIERDPRRLDWQNVYGHGDSDEKEVPIAHGAPIHLTGVSWRTHKDHPILGEVWHRHTLSEPVTLRAHDNDSPDDETQWNTPPEQHTSLLQHFGMASNSQEHNRAFGFDHPHPTYVRFGDWPADERSMNHITGHREEGVSVYDLDKHGQPMDPDYDMDRGEHYEGCGGPEHCDLWEHDPENTEMHDDTHDMLQGHLEDCRRGRNTSPDRRAHLVQGKWTGFGHDDEPVIQKVKKVGHWPCDVHKFVPGAEKVQPSWCEHSDHDDDWTPYEGSLLQHFAEHDWRGSHRPAGPEEPALHELPDDLYEHPEYHNGPRPPGSVSRYHCSIEWRDAKRGYENAMGAFQQMKKARGNPEAPVSIYRAVPHHVTDIHSGDWVTLHPGYAQQHGMSNVPEDDDYRILKATVPAKHVNWSQDAFDEWGYNGPDISHAEEHHGRQPELPFHSEDELRHEGAKEDDDLDFRDAMEQFMDLLASDPSNPPGTVKMLNDPEVRGRFMNHIDKTTPHYAPGTFERHIDDQLKGKEGAKDDHQGIEDHEWDYLSKVLEATEQLPDAKACYQVSTAIHRRLGWPQESGYYVGGGHREGHYWNRKPDGTIVDATHDQFDDQSDPVRVIPPGHPGQADYEPSGKTATKDDDAEYQQRVREHAERQATRPGYSPGDDLSGWDGYPHAEWVPIEVAQRFREHSGVQHAGSEQKVDEIASQLRSGRGMTDPLMLLHHNEENVASLGEGNHRLTAAERAGWSHVPMRVCRMYDSEVKGARGNPPPRSVPARWRGTHSGRTPEMCSPSDVLSVGSKAYPSQHTAAKEEAPQPLPFEPGKTWYRVHHPDSPWGPEHARSSTGFGIESGDATVPGYSSFASPHDLHRYWTTSGWDHEKRQPLEREDLIGQGQVVRFRGHHAGWGVDREPTVVPHGEPEEKMSWGRFKERLAVTPHPDVKAHWHDDYGWWHGQGERCIRGSDHEMEEPHGDEVMWEDRHLIPGVDRTVPDNLDDDDLPEHTSAKRQPPWVGYDDLDEPAQSTIHQYMGEGEFDSPEQMEAHKRKYEYQTEHVPVEEFKRRVMQHGDVHTDWGKDFENYHKWYTTETSGHTPEHGESRWPAIENSPEMQDSWGYLQDGWHRAHSYVRAGDSHIPVVRLRGRNQRLASKEEVCDGTGHLPRAMSREPDRSLVGMCISCMDYHPVTEVVPPSKPEWPKEFRLAPHAPSLPQQHQAATLSDWDDEENDEGRDRDRDEHGDCIYYPGHEHEHENMGYQDGYSKHCPYETQHTDWSRVYGTIHHIHRGLGLRVSDEVHQIVHDPAVSEQTKARTIVDHLSGDHLGMHWSTSAEESRDYAHRNMHDDYRKPADNALAVVVHAHTPRLEDIEQDPLNLDERNVIGFDHHEDAEVPLRNGAPVKVHSVSWLKDDPDSQVNHHLDESWHHVRLKPYAEHIAVVGKAKDTDHSKGVMVALVPPPKVAEALVQEDGTEPVDSLHITLAYLGETTEMTKAQLRDLPEVVAAWAEAEMPLSATTQGAGTFLKADEDGQHVMWASVAIPGVNLMHERLIHALTKHGYSPRTDHEFQPHITLSYEKYHVRFLPKVERMSFDLDEVWCVIAGEWENFSLGSS